MSTSFLTSAGRSPSPQHSTPTEPVAEARAARRVSRLIHRLGGAGLGQAATPLNRHGNALLLNTAVSGALGLAYWVVAARLFPAASVGAAGALVAAMGGLAAVGQLNLSGALMRFLPTAGSDTRSLVLRCYLVAAGLATALAVVAVTVIPQMVMHPAPGRALLFCVAVAAWTIFSLQDSVLIGARRAGWVPVENLVFGVAKVVALLVLASAASPDAIFASWVLPLLVVVPAVNLLLFRRVLPRRPAGPEGHERGENLRGLGRFAAGEAGGGFFQECLAYLLPVAVVALLGVEANAGFYVAFTMMTSLDLIAANLSSSLTVEGAHSPARLAAMTRATLRRTLLLSGAAVATLVAAAPWVLRLYGGGYAADATTTLRLLALATLPKAVIVIYLAVSRVQHKTHRAVWASGATCLGTFGGAVATSGRFGVNGVALALLGSSLLVALAVLPQVWQMTRRQERAAEQGSVAGDGPLRVLEVTARYLPELGGVETHVYEVTRRVAALGGFDMTVLTSDRSGALPASERVPEGFGITRIAAYPRKRDYFIAPKIFPAVRGGDWDVVHIQGVHNAMSIFAMIAALSARVPFVLTFHTGGHPSRLRTALRALQWRALAPLLRRAEVLVAVSTFEKQLFLRCTGVPEEQIVVIRNGGGLPQVRGVTRAPGRIISSGRLEEFKGHHRVIEALAELRQHVPDAHLLILGAGPYEARLRQLAAELGVQDAVEIRYIGTDEREQMARCLASASVFAALSDYEAHPVAVMEALTLGVPVVGYDVAGTADLVAEGLVSGVPQGASAVQVARALLVAMDDDGQADGRPPLPTWETSAQGLAEVYRQAWASGPSRAGARRSANGGQGTVAVSSIERKEPR